MLKVFMSYAKEDLALVDPYFQKLAEAKFIPWMDHRSILPGADWPRELRLAMERSEVVILFCSPRSVTKTGFVQAEARLAVEKLQFSPEGFITVIPAMLEPCEVPRHVRERVQIVDLTLDGAWDRLLQSLQVAASERQIAIETGTVVGPFTVFLETLSESKSVAPIYDFLIQYPRFESSTNTRAAVTLTQIFAGQAHAKMAKERTDMDTEIGDEGDAWWSTLGNTYTEEVQVVFANDIFISTVGTVATYYRGAAHGNSFFETLNYLIDGGVRPFRLPALFVDEAAGLGRLSELCKNAVERQMWQRSGSRADTDTLRWIAEGAGAKWENFEAFTLDADGITIYFAPYAVAAYVYNTFTVSVSYFDLLDVLKADGLHTKLAAI